MVKAEDDPRKELPEYIEIIRRNVRAYQNNYVDENYSECVPALYFIFENMCKYILAVKGFRTATHDGVQTLLARHFVKPGDIDKTVHHRLTNLYLRRKDADYHGYLSFDKTDVDEYAGWVRDSFRAMEQYFHKEDRKTLQEILPEIGRGSNPSIG